MALIASQAMDPNQRRRILGLATVGLAVFGLLTLTALGSRSLPGTTRSVALSWTVDVIEMIQVAIGVAIIAAVILSLIASRRNKDEEKLQKKSPPRHQPWFVVLPVLAAMALLVYLFLNRTPAVLEEEATAPEFSFSRVDFLPMEEVGAAWPLLALIALAVVAALAISVLTRAQPDPEPDADAAALLADSLSGALAALDWSDDPRSVIIRAYHDIETELAGAGMPRLASEAPREYLERVLSNLGVEPGSITHLTTLFELARFSEQDLGAAEVDDAQAAMQSVLTDLGVSAR